MCPRNDGCILKMNKRKPKQCKCIVCCILLGKPVNLHSQRISSFITMFANRWRCIRYAKDAGIHTLSDYLYVLRPNAATVYCSGIASCCLEIIYWQEQQKKCLEFHRLNHRIFDTGGSFQDVKFL